MAHRNGAPTSNGVGNGSTRNNHIDGAEEQFPIVRVLDPVEQTRNLNSAASQSLAFGSDEMQKLFQRSTPVGNNSAKRIQKDLEELMANPIDGCNAGPKGDSLHEWMGTIEGPPNTVYAGGIFFIEILFSADYPFKPPKVVFRTRIYHPNINSQGLIALDALKDSWNSTNTISKVLRDVYGLLETCDPSKPLVTNIAKQYVQNREEHDRTARLWTERYAM